MSALDLSAVDLRTEVVRTGRLLLRPFRPSDADAVFAGCQDPEVRRWIPAVPVPSVRADAAHVVGVVGPEGRARLHGG
jgi:RimJ/RimL family protein N-acetyltransferase